MIEKMAKQLQLEAVAVGLGTSCWKSAQPRDGLADWCVTVWDDPRQAYCMDTPLRERIAQAREAKERERAQRGD